MSESNPEEDMKAIAGALAKQFEPGGVFEGITSFAFASDDDDEEPEIITKEDLEEMSK